LKSDSPGINVAFDNYAIVTATIYGSASAVQHPLAPSSLQNTNRKLEGR